MKDLIDIIAESLKDRGDRQEILLIVESLYFNDVQKRVWRRPKASKESTLIAYDIINLENSLKSFNSIQGVRVKSELIKYAMQRVSTDGICKDIETLSEVNSTQKNFFNQEVLKANRNYVTAVMLAELIRDEKRRTKYHQWLAFLLPICTAVISAVAIILTKYWR